MKDKTCGRWWRGTRWLVLGLLLPIGAACAASSAEKEKDKQLIAAAKRGEAATVAPLSEQGASVRTRDESGVTALIAAAYRNHLETAVLLIKAGADVNAQDNTQQSAYLLATSEGRLPLLKLALRAGTDVRSLDSYNGTGLIRAADRGHVAISKVLLKTKLQVNHVNRLGWTALLEAIILGDGGPRHTEVVRLDVQAGADVNLADSGGVTPLAHAVQRGYGKLISILERPGRVKMRKSLFVLHSDDHQTAVSR